jgi:hypothetical protein
MKIRRWPLAVIAAPAAVSIWSGWVGLGGLSGFGDVEPLPGIVPLHINTALTLPLGIESYAALALGAWLRPGTMGRARRFARWSALGALVLGMLGQVSYHLLAARHAARAPDIVVVLVACLPVVVLGCAVALMHLLRADEGLAEGTADLSENLHDALSESESGTAVPTGSQTAIETGTPTVAEPVRKALPGPVPETDAEPVRKALPGPVPETDAEPVRKPAPNRSGSRKPNRSATAEDADREFAAEIAGGEVPSLYQIRSRLHVGNERAKVLRQHIARQALTT